jgi:hypothetical protein
VGGLPDPRFNAAEVPVVAFLGLMHLRAPLTAAVLGRAGRVNQGGINNGSCLEHLTLLYQHGVDLGQQLIGDTMSFQPRAEVSSKRGLLNIL